MDVEEDLSQLCERALEGGEADGFYWNVVFGENVVLKVPKDKSIQSGRVDEEIVRENMEIRDEIGFGMIDADLEENLVDDRIAMVQKLGEPSVTYAPQYPEDFVRQAVQILDHVSETDYIIDGKVENFVVVEVDVKYCDLGDVASFSTRANDHMYNKFISSLKRRIDCDLREIDSMVEDASNVYNSVIPEIYVSD